MTTVETEAFVVEKPGEKLKLQKIVLAPLAPTEVEVEIEYCGLCHTDVHMAKNDWGCADYPLVPGHEGVGRVKAVGPKVNGLKIGDRIGIGWLRGSCGSCDPCSQGEENFCTSGYQGTFLSCSAGCWGKTDCRQQGCFSKIMHIEEKFAFKLPDELKSEQAAPLMCAGITVWEPIVRYVKPGTYIGVVALGGLGHMAVKLLRAVGASVCVLSSSDSKRDRALRELGAKQYINYNNPEDMKKIANTLDLIIDTCPVVQDVAPYLGALRFGGTYVRVGIPEAGSSAFTYNFIPLIFTGKTIAGSIVSGSKNTKAMLRMAADHQIHSDVEIIPFLQINEAMDKLVKQKNEAFRIVLKW